jgi:hypothetical protein
MEEAQACRLFIYQGVKRRELVKATLAVSVRVLSLTYLYDADHVLKVIVNGRPYAFITRQEVAQMGGQIIGMTLLPGLGKYRL